MPPPSTHPHPPTFFSPSEPIGTKLERDYPCPLEGASQKFNIPENI